VDKDSDRFAVAVGKLGIAVVTPQILLADKDRDVRYRAAEAVGKLGAAAAKPEILDTLYTLSSLLADESWGVRDYAARVLAKLGVAGILQVLNTLSRFSAGKNEHVCRYAIEAVANLGPAVATPQIMYTLQRLLTDEDSYVRRQTAKVIGTLGAAAATSEILAMLPRLLLDENKYVRCNTAETVGKLGAAAATPEILDALQRLLVLVDEGICAMQAIANLGAASLLPRTLDELPRLLVDEDRGVRLIATRAVGKLGAAVATPEILNTLQRELLNNFQHFLFEVSYSYDGHEQFGWCYNRFGWRHDYEYQYDGWWDDEWYRDEYHDCLNNLRKCTLYKLVKEASISEVLHWFLNMFSAPEIKNDEVLPILQICLSSAFIFIPSFWLENANHRNMFVFLSHVLAVAYFNNQISCQVYFDEDAQLKSYYMRGFIGKFSYSVPVMPIQAECLRELSGLIIEQLSKTGKLDIAELKARLPKWNEAVQELLSSKHKSSSLKAADPGSVPNLQDHIVPSTSRQPQPRMLTQYHQFTPPASVVVENPKQIVETEQPVKNLKIVNKQNVGKDLREHTAPHTSEQKSPRMLTQSQLAIPAIATVGNPKQVIKTDELARAASQNEVTVRNTSRVSQLKKLYEK
jgi:HEAT repeat protein